MHRRQSEDAARAALGDAAYDADSELGPAGYLAHHVRIAVGLALRALERGEAGSVATYDVHSGRITAQRVLAVHGCTRCDNMAMMGPRDESTGMDGAIAAIREPR